MSNIINPSKWVYFDFPLASAFYVDSLGLLRVAKNSDCALPPEDVRRKTNESLAIYLLDCGYRGISYSEDFFTIGGSTMYGYLSRRVGRSWDDCCQHFRLVEDIRTKNKEKRKKEDADWKYLCSKFRGLVLGLDRKVDFRASGDFAVYLAIKTGSYPRQLEFVKKNQGEITQYVVKELQSRKRSMARIGDIRFYEISSVTLLRSSMVEFIFSPKKGLEELLASVP